MKPEIFLIAIFIFFIKAMPAYSESKCHMEKVMSLYPDFRQAIGVYDDFNKALDLYENMVELLYLGSSTRCLYWRGKIFHDLSAALHQQERHVEALSKIEIAISYRVKVMEDTYMGDFDLFNSMDVYASIKFSMRDDSWVRVRLAIVQLIDEFMNNLDEFSVLYMDRLVAEYLRISELYLELGEISLGEKYVMQAERKLYETEHAPDDIVRDRIDVIREIISSDQSNK